MNDYHMIYVTAPAKKDQVGTKYTISQNYTYLKFCVQYLLSVSFEMQHTKVFIDGKMFLQWLLWIISYDAPNLKNIMKFYVPTWSIFAGQVIYIIGQHK